MKPKRQTAFHVCSTRLALKLHKLLFWETDLLGEVLDDAVLGHLGADGEASLQLLLNARDHFLVLLRGEALHSWLGKNVV